jgi:hypothetical protein
MFPFGRRLLAGRAQGLRLDAGSSRPQPRHRSVGRLDSRALAFLQRLGVFHLMADGGKMLFKEDPLPGHVNKFYFYPRAQSSR